MEYAIKRKYATKTGYNQITGMFPLFFNCRGGGRNGKAVVGDLTTYFHVSN
jgi:hypothetical protein